MCTRKFVLGIALSIIVLLVVANVSAQDTNPRFGVWRNQSNPNNVMTYEPYGDGGMKITVATTRNGNTSEWSYVTLFDGAFHPVVHRRAEHQDLQQAQWARWPGHNQHTLGRWQHHQ